MTLRHLVRHLLERHVRRLRCDRLAADGARAPTRLGLTEVRCEARIAEGVSAREEQDRPVRFARHELVADRTGVCGDVVVEERLYLPSRRRPGVSLWVRKVRGCADSQWVSFLPQAVLGAPSHRPRPLSSGWRSLVASRPGAAL